MEDPSETKDIAEKNPQVSRHGDSCFSPDFLGVSIGVKLCKYQVWTIKSTGWLNEHVT